MELKCFAITQDATIRQVLTDLDLAEQREFVLFEEASHLFSAQLDSMHFILIDDEATGGNYLQIIKKLRKRIPEIETMVIGGPKSKEVIEREWRDGIDYYFPRPLDRNNLLAVIQHRLNITRLKTAASFVGRSPEIQEILESVLLVGPTEVPILIEGESGTGKDVLAKAIHLTSNRIDAPFEAINCASLAEGVLESELFGHEKGSFTGAVAQRQGIFERANSGTIFLDEVGEMSANMQVRLLRVLESGEVLRVGGVKHLEVDVRVIAATNKNLSESVRSGEFRQDLYYRMKGVTFYLPPLRKRTADLQLLVHYFIHGANRKHGKKISGIEPDALRKMNSYSWPGNIRELRNVIDTLVVLAGGDKITANDVDMQLHDTAAVDPPLLPIAANKSKAEAEREMIYASILALHRDVREIINYLHGSASRDPWEGMREVTPGDREQKPRVETLSQMERTAIKEALRASGGNRRKASELLGISERTLYRKIQEYGLV